MKLEVIREANGIKPFDAAAEKIFVNSLWNGDADAWEKIYSSTVLPVLCMATRTGIPYHKIIADRGLTQWDIYGMLYEEMIVKRKLEKYQFRCPVIYWMRAYVMKLILNYCKKFSVPVSDEHSPEVFTYDNTKEQWEVVQKSFAELWRKNPMRAYIYFLRRYEGLSSGEIRSLLGVSSASNVDQYFKRADADMSVLLKKMSGECK